MANTTSEIYICHFFVEKKLGFHGKINVLESNSLNGWLQVEDESKLVEDLIVELIQPSLFQLSI